MGSVFAVAGAATIAFQAHREGPRTRIGLLLVDRHVEDARRLRAAAEREGALVLDAGTDLAPVYVSQLLPRWRACGGCAVAGMSGAVTLFYLEHLARDFGLRTVFLQRGAIDVSALLRLPDAVPTSGVVPAVLRGDDALFSWVLAPRMSNCRTS